VPYQAGPHPDTRPEYPIRREMSIIIFSYGKSVVFYR
jgi:hypothetical protein